MNFSLFKCVTCCKSDSLTVSTNWLLFFACIYRSVPTPITDQAYFSGCCFEPLYHCSRTWLSTTDCCLLFFLIYFLNLRYYSGYNFTIFHGFSKIFRTIFPSIFLFTDFIHCFAGKKGVPWQPILITMMEGLLWLIVNPFLGI